MTSLADAALGVPLVMSAMAEDGTATTDRSPAEVAALRRRLAELGMRPGSPVTCVQRTSGGGRIVDLAGSRVALGRDVLPLVLVTAAS